MGLEIDTRELRNTINQVTRKVPVEAASFLNGKLKELADISQDLVPYGEPARYKTAGEPHLRDTMTVTRAVAAVVATGDVSYSSVYAFDVHENPRSGRTGGFSPSGEKYVYYARDGSFKYLEQPFLAIRATLLSDFATHLAFRL